MNTVSKAIKNFLESRKWEYKSESIENHEEVDSYWFSLECEHEVIHCRIIVDPNKNLFHLTCFSQEVIAEAYIPEAIKAMNNFNLRSNMVIGCINDGGRQVYSIGVFTGGISVFTEETFKMYLEMVTDIADNEIAYIYKNAIKSNTIEITEKKRGIFSLFKK